MSNSLRVAIFTETFLPKLDGQVTITCLLLDHLKRIGAEAIIFVPGDRVDSYAGYRVVTAPGIPAPWYPEAVLSLPGEDWYETLRDFDPDIVHVINPVSSGLRGMQFARRLDKPLLLSFHTHLMEMARFYGMGVFEDTLWQIHRFVYSKADYVLATSKHAVKDLQDHGFGEVGLWRRGVDVQNYNPAHASHEMRCRLSNNQPEKPLLLSAGRLAPEKQVEQIVSVLDEIPEAHLAIIGDGPHRVKLEAAFEGYPVTFTGYMSGHELATAYASADIFLFPSSSIETFGLVVAEAMASGLAVVASRVGGVPELIEHGVNGYIFPENHVKSMTNYVRDLVDDPQKQERFGWQARQSVSQLTWTNIMDELFDDYHRVIAEYHRGQIEVAV